MISYAGRDAEALVISAGRLKTLYKHVDEVAAGFLAKGNVRLRRLSAFRNIEGQPAGIQDPLEGRAVLCANQFQATETSNPGAVAAVRRFFDVRGPESIFMDHAHLTEETIDYWVLCLTSQPTSFWPDRPCTWRINDLAGLVRVLMKAMPSDLIRPRAGPVRYQPRIGDIAVDHAMRASPLIKELKFAWQKEERLFFDPGQATSSDTLDIYCPEILNFTSVIPAIIEEHYEAQ